MKKLSVILFLPFMLSACQDTIKGNGNIIQENRVVEPFNEIKTSGVFSIVLVEGEPNVSIQADENLMEYIGTSVNGEQLVISSGGKYLDSEDMEITIYYVNLEEISISGAAEIKAMETIDGKRLQISVSGAAQADLELRLEELKVEVSGGAELDLAGYAERSSYELTGAAEIRAGGLKSNMVSIDISGASELVVNAQTELDVEISGAGEVQYYGNPTIKESISGAGELIQLK